MTRGKPQNASASGTALATTISVSTVLPTARREGVVVLGVGGQTLELPSSEAFDLQRRILSATIAVQRAGVQVEATRKAKEQRELRRAASVDEALRKHDG
ncbi:hypothetical protein [Microbacterium imperiale]|uniref:Uncharacterized protein n=1 Tax=Microbacterium imperiale TaxID=33884 RepID=A0A9W6M2J5_9MICO|nr:hypothetical protein [Microbacterium imperiale]MBP2419663.1 hypothetical protein [Microbacterium imperiale]MDS0198471.1 hypothetical protein [Microbacterium imperiale]BFE40004.1 hypothetical protein GCM10017544_09600 [Microbacterium imperiale]GLJ79021.1 hypothetical protein GCM10017586_07030 [Microbacterium imperiale]